MLYLVVNFRNDFRVLKQSSSLSEDVQIASHQNLNHVLATFFSPEVISLMIHSARMIHIHINSYLMEIYNKVLHADITELRVQNEVFLSVTFKGLSIEGTMSYRFTPLI